MKDPWKNVELYKQWALESNPNTKKTVIIYVSAYGYTGEIAKKIEEGIRAAGDIDVRSYDMVDADSKFWTSYIGPTAFCSELLPL